MGQFTGLVNLKKERNNGHKLTRLQCYYFLVLAKIIECKREMAVYQKGTSLCILYTCFFSCIYFNYIDNLLKII
jgi:hypothetical protein